MPRALGLPPLLPIAELSVGSYGGFLVVTAALKLADPLPLYGSLSALCALLGSSVTGEGLEQLTRFVVGSEAAAGSYILLCASRCATRVFATAWAGVYCAGSLLLVIVLGPNSDCGCLGGSGSLLLSLLINVLVLVALLLIDRSGRKLWGQTPSAAFASSREGPLS